MKKEKLIKNNWNEIILIFIPGDEHGLYDASESRVGVVIAQIVLSSQN